jgi:hypothetical protein
MPSSAISPLWRAFYKSLRSSAFWAIKLEQEVETSKAGSPHQGSTRCLKRLYASRSHKASSCYHQWKGTKHYLSISQNQRGLNQDPPDSKVRLGTHVQKKFYLCACGHYALKSTQAPCPEIDSRSISTPSAIVAEADAQPRATPDVDSGHHATSPIRRSWSVEVCRTLQCLYRKRDLYWKKRWCEDCRRQGIRARNRLIKLFGSLGDVAPPSRRWDFDFGSNDS